MKYHNKVVLVGGQKYDSHKECNRFAELSLLERAGAISRLERQVRFVLIPSQRCAGKCLERECAYIADFTYLDEHGELIVEDSKGYRTPEYIIKRKLMLWVHGIKIKET